MLTDDHNVAMRVIGIRASDDGIPPQRAVVLLREIEGNRYVPIHVGATEGQQIAWYLSKTPVVRPPLFDWFATLLRQAGADMRHVTLTNLTVGVLYAVLTVETMKGPRQVDARPSDGILLALASGRPIFASPATLWTENSPLAQ